MSNKKTNKMNVSKTPSLKEAYEFIAKDVHKSPYIGRDWPKENGLYKHYSAYESNTKCITKSIV